MNLPSPLRLLRVTTACSCLWMLTLIIMHSQSGVGILELLLFVYGGAALLLSFALLLFSSRVRGSPLAQRLATPVVLVATIALVALAESSHNPLFQLRFALSEAALTDAAERKLKSPAAELPGWVGLFPIDSVEIDDGQVRFLTASCGVVDRCGVVYSPGRVPRRIYEDRFTPLTDTWYHVYQGF